MSAPDQHWRSWGRGVDDLLESYEAELLPGQDVGVQADVDGNGPILTRAKLDPIGAVFADRHIDALGDRSAFIDEQVGIGIEAAGLRIAALVYEDVVRELDDERAAGLPVVSQGDAGIGQGGAQGAVEVGVEVVADALGRVVAAPDVGSAELHGDDAVGEGLIGREGDVAEHAQVVVDLGRGDGRAQAEGSGEEGGAGGHCCHASSEARAEPMHPWIDGLCTNCAVEHPADPAIGNGDRICRRP
ncbi:MAG: hypothetical protein AAF799_26950 [Myxococcota bacterium]